jgi:serine/threonine protein phosphatase PrpC
VHVGDSRCYLLRGGELEQITRDHTMSAVMAEVGQMTADEARRSPMRHALWNVLGGRSDDLAVDVYKLTLEPDDKLLLCTDGLYDMVSDETLRQILASDQSAEVTCRKLVELANENGGSDNITVIVSHFFTPKLEEPRAFVEAEVPLEVLTAPVSDTSKTTTFDSARAS